MMPFLNNSKQKVQVGSCGYMPDVTKEKNMSDSPSTVRLLSAAEIIESDMGHTQEKGKTEIVGTNDERMVINPGTEDQMEVWGYKEDLFRLVVTWAMILLSCGLIGLPLYWWKQYWLRLTHSPCSLAQATSVLVVDNYKGLHTTYYVKKVYEKKTESEEILLPLNEDPGYQAFSELREFRCKKAKYIWDRKSLLFYRVQGLDRNIPLATLHQYKVGLTETAKKQRSILYGKNEIKVPVHSIPVLLVKEVLTPFYVFQVFSVALWYSDDYWIYATAILVTSLVSLTFAVYNLRNIQRNLRDTIVSSDVVRVLRPEGITQVISSELAPGDIIEVPSHGCKILCDAVLIQGQAIMNESMLTGESIPITKTTCPDDADVVYNDKEHSKHTLNCGTEVIQTRAPKGQSVRAVVLRTGYLTAKGGLVRSILYPPPVDFKFEQDSYKFVGFLALVACIGMVYTLVQMVIAGEGFGDILLEVLDLITIVVPPALPAAMTIGILIAQKKLRQKEIFCISPRSINVAGSTDCVCFDKTGTITEDGMDMWGLVPTVAGKVAISDIPSEEAVFLPAVKNIESLPSNGHLVVGMSICHDLNRIDGEIQGDPLDVKMFASTGWSLEHQGDEENQVDQYVMPFVRSPPNGLSDSVIQAAPLRLFQFNSDDQRMSVVCRLLEERPEGWGQPACVVYCKGSPEMIRSLCAPETIPAEFPELLEHYTSKGYRVLGMAAKHLPANRSKIAKISKMTRLETESDLTFLGLIILENRLKPASGAVIRELQGADIRPIMVTGDNILTAVSVAKECGIVPAGETVVKVVARVVDKRPTVSYHLLETGSPTHKNGVAFINGNNPKHVKLTIDQPKYHLAVDGASFEVICEHFREELMHVLATKGAVFARMRPEKKQQLVEILQDLGYFVAMCGDGANDCGALKAAHAGISLSEAEASVASPFTSKNPDISCVPILIREGRAALVTSFGIFKYMAAYSITQFTSVMILYNIQSNLSDWQFTWIDLFVISSLAFLFGFNGSYKGQLANQPPMKSLISPTPIFSILSQLAICIAFQVGALFYTESQPWFVPFDEENSCYVNTTVEKEYNLTGIAVPCDPEEDPVASFENYSIFSVSQFQYIILAVVFAKGPPYRRNIFYNFGLIIDMFILTAASIYLTISPHPFFINIFEIFLAPVWPFRWILLAFVAANFFVSLFTEMFLSDLLFQRFTNTKNELHNKIESDLQNKPDWPPISPSQTESIASETPQKKKSDVIITQAELAHAKEDAFESLFSTPTDSGFHALAASSLNTNGKDKLTTEIAMGSNYCSAQTTPAKLTDKLIKSSSPLKSVAALTDSVTTSGSSSASSKFVSCNSLLQSPGGHGMSLSPGSPGSARNGGSGSRGSDTGSDEVER